MVNVNLQISLMKRALKNAWHQRWSVNMKVHVMDNTDLKKLALPKYLAQIKSHPVWENSIGKRLTWH